MLPTAISCFGKP